MADDGRECLTTTTSAASYRTAVDRIVALPTVTAWQATLGKHRRMAQVPDTDKTEFEGGHCYWSIGIYESASTHLHLWNSFRVDVKSHAVFVMDEDGRYVPAKTR